MKTVQLIKLKNAGKESTTVTGLDVITQKLEDEGIEKTQ